jgi:uncharacterized membrane protein
MSLDALFEADPVIQFHVACATGALILGALQWLGPKGTLPHRTLGMVWAGLMALTALSAVFIREVNEGQFSLIHLLIPLTLFGLVGLARSVRKSARKGQHHRLVITLYFCALIVPGLFAFLPGRLFNTVFLSSLSGS